MSKPLENVGAYMSLAVLFLVLCFSALTWDRPGINGDEFNFLWPLLTEPISAIRNFYVYQKLNARTRFVNCLGRLWRNSTNKLQVI